MDVLVPELGPDWAIHLSREGLLALLDLHRRSTRHSRSRDISPNARDVIISRLGMVRECQFATLSDPWPPRP